MGEADRQIYDFASPFLLAPGSTRLIQIQATRRCNLRCVHCYSRSGPELRDTLPYEPLRDFLEEARELEYNYVGVSGGEPLLWGDLDRFLDLARQLGFSTSITTNGTMLDRARAAALRRHLGVAGISVDGMPEDHARVRQSDAAFAAMRRGISAAVAENIPVALAFTLTRHNCDQLLWLIEFANEVGASGVNVHPLCDFGAATENLRFSIPDSQEFRTAGWLLALLVQDGTAGDLALTMDAIERRVIEQSCWPMARCDAEAIATSRFADLVPALVLDTDGAIVPYIYGFPRQWSIGAIGRGSLADAAARWRDRSAMPVASMIRSTLDRLASDGEDYIDLFGQLLTTACSAATAHAVQTA